MQPGSHARGSMPPISRSQSQSRSHVPVHRGGVPPAGVMNARNIDPWMPYRSSSPLPRAIRRGSLVSYFLQPQAEFSRPQMNYPPVAARGFLPQQGGTANYPSYRTGLGRPLRQLHHHDSALSNPLTNSIPALYCSPDRPYSAPTYANPLSRGENGPGIVLPPRSVTSLEANTANTEMPPPRPPVFPERRAVLQDDKVSKTTPSSTQDKGESTKLGSATKRVARRGLTKTLPSSNNSREESDLPETYPSSITTMNLEPIMPIRSKKRANEYAATDPKLQKRPFISVVWNNDKSKKDSPHLKDPYAISKTSRQSPEVSHDGNSTRHRAQEESDKNIGEQSDDETMTGDSDCASQSAGATSKTRQPAPDRVSAIAEYNEQTKIVDELVGAILQQLDVISQSPQGSTPDLIPKQHCNASLKSGSSATQPAIKGAEPDIEVEAIDDTIPPASDCPNRPSKDLEKTQGFNFNSQDHKEGAPGPTTQSLYMNTEVQCNIPHQLIDAGTQTTSREKASNHRLRPLPDAKTLSRIFKEAELMLDKEVTHDSSLEEIYATLTNMKTLVSTEPRLGSVLETSFSSGLEVA
ncbi:hypothetical protein F5B20DRAFT_541914 [Whalleya microplaca]|nr:hypothetical protein F5B20DRAFT_541914 [Whalleya microplaca]